MTIPGIRPALDAEVLLDLQQFLATMDATKSAALDLSGAFRGPVDALVTEFFRRRFDSEGAYLGTAWAKHARATLRARKQPGRGRGGILRDLNDLWASLTKSGGPGSIRDVGAMLYRRGTTDPKAALHQRGTKHMPARPLIPEPVPQALVDEITDAVRDWLAKRAAA
jgi:hypothetical protein